MMLQRTQMTLVMSTIEHLLLFYGYHCFLSKTIGTGLAALANYDCAYPDEKCFFRCVHISEAKRGTTIFCD